MRRIADETDATPVTGRKPGALEGVRASAARRLAPSCRTLAKYAMIATIKRIVFSLLPVKQRFRRIYRRHYSYWKSSEVASGLGSTLANTENIRTALPALLREYNIETIVDVPCGDFNWMRCLVEHVPLIATYTGLDIVPEIISENQRKYGTDRIQFAEFDVIKSVPLSADLVLMRDCLIHFSFVDARRALRNIKNSGSHYFLSTTHLEVAENTDIVTGRWRPVNLEKAPYNFPPPLELIRENEGHGKCLGLWRVSDMPD
jgi:SAM-dependent methyltransferase